MHIIDLQQSWDVLRADQRLKSLNPVEPPDICGLHRLSSKPVRAEHGISERGKSLGSASIFGVPRV